MTSKDVTASRKSILKAALAGLAICAAVSLGTMSPHTAVGGASARSPLAATAPAASGDATDPWGRWPNATA